MITKVLKRSFEIVNCFSKTNAYIFVTIVGNNALHVACREGHLNAVKELLSESQINAEAVDIRGRTPLHVLAKYSRDNASAICELFIEFMPAYPLDKPDAEGNTGLWFVGRIFHEL